MLQRLHFRFSETPTSKPFAWGDRGGGDRGRDSEEYAKWLSKMEKDRRKERTHTPLHFPSFGKKLWPICTGELVYSKEKERWKETKPQRNRSTRAQVQKSPEPPTSAKQSKKQQTARWPSIDKKTYHNAHHGSSSKKKVMKPKFLKEERQNGALFFEFRKGFN